MRAENVIRTRDLDERIELLEKRRCGGTRGRHLDEPRPSRFTDGRTHTLAPREAPGQGIERINGPYSSFVDLNRGFFRVFGRVKLSVLLGFTLAAFNLERIRSFRAKHALGGDGSGLRAPSNSSPRRKRRRGTWAQIIEERPQPPPVVPPQ